MRNWELKIAIIRKFGTQTEFAREVGLREDRISRIIQGRMYPTEYDKEIISAKLGKKKEELF